MKQSLALTTIVVADCDDAIDFYLNTLGFDLPNDTCIRQQDERWVVVKPAGSCESICEM